MRPVIRRQLELGVVRLVNGVRQHARVHSLTVDALLGDAARAHSADMVHRRYFSHVSPDGDAAHGRLDVVGYLWSNVGENIAWGQPDAASVVAAWMASRGHRANILDERFEQIGVGVVEDQSGLLVWTQNFAAPARRSSAA